MTRARLLLTLIFLATFCPGTRSYAQSPGESARPAVPDVGAETPNPLPDLPRLPDEPRSLFAPAPSAGPPGLALPGPYFEEDPRLDPPNLPLPGWFADVETEIAAAHVKNKLSNTVSIGTAAPNRVSLPSAELDWTVAPRFELGYRLPSGFGAFAFAYRFLTTEGTQGTIGADGPASLHSRLELNEFDFDYVSREFSLWPLWEMQWRFGGRLTELFFDSRADEGIAQAAAGSGIFESRVSNSYVGFGPHWGVELVRRLDESGFSLVGRADGALHLGRLRQRFSEASTTSLVGETRTSSSQAVPMLNTQAGIGWNPPAYPHLQFFLGYEYEYWWNVGRDSRTTSRGEMFDQGIFLRAQFNF
jgi:hypothetical protein